MAQLPARGVQAVFRLSAARNWHANTIRHLGPGDRLPLWKRPRKPTTGFDRRQWRELPEQLTIRIVEFSIEGKGFRTRRVTLATTLLDRKRYSANELAELYLKRWRIELYFRDIKTVMGMEVLSCTTPQRATI